MPLEYDLPGEDDTEDYNHEIFGLQEHCRKSLQLGR